MGTPRRSDLILLVSVIVCLAVALDPALARGEEAANWAAGGERYALTVYVGQFSDENLNRFYQFHDSLEGNFIGVAALSWEFMRFFDLVGVELEGQFVQHLGDQTFPEVNACLVLRWLEFPWNDYVPTTFAVGEGASYANAIPRYEVFENDDSAHFLNYLMFELTLGLPSLPQWSASFRIHHRSGAYGLYGTHTGSNFLCAGLRYEF